MYMNVNDILPQELFSSICTRLNTDDQERCRLVCRSWNDTIVSLSNSKLRASFEKVLQNPSLSILAATGVHSQFSACHALINQHLVTNPHVQSPQILRQLTLEIGPTFVLVKLLRVASVHAIEKGLFNDLCLARRSCRDLRRFAQVASPKVREIVEKYLIRQGEYQEAERLMVAVVRQHPKKRKEFETALLQANALDYLLGYQSRVTVTADLLHELGVKLIAANRVDDAEEYARTIAFPDVEYKVKMRIAKHFVNSQSFERACTYFTANFPSHYLAAYSSFFSDLVKNGQSLRAWQFCHEAKKDTFFTLLVLREVEEGHAENAYRAFNEIKNRLQKMKAARILTYYEARVGSIQKAYELGLEHVWKSCGLMKNVLIKVHLYSYRFARSIGA